MRESLTRLAHESLMSGGAWRSHHVLVFGADTAHGQTPEQTPETGMAALKLFISHSSRPHDDKANDAWAQHNWQILQDTVKVLKEAYGDKIEILVDYQELHPGDDWETKIYEWVWQCDAAIILFSRRAVDESDWVKIETTHLVSRKRFDPEFKLFFVPIAGQTTKEDLNKGYYEKLIRSRWQFVPAASTGQEIVTAIQPTLGDPASLPSHRQTAFQRLLGKVADWITHHLDRDTLTDLWDHLCPGRKPLQTHRDQVKCYASALAEHLLNDGEQALRRVQDVLDCLRLCPTFSREPAEQLLKSFNAIWVNAEAAGQLPATRAQCLALNGLLVGYPDPEYPDRPFFTLNRYLKRAWPESKRIRLIPVTKTLSGSGIREEIRKVYQRGRYHLSDDELSLRVVADDWQGIVFVAATLWPDGIIDPRLVDELQALKAQYQPLIFVLGIEGNMRDDLPEGVQPILPALSLDTEDCQHAAEIDAWNLINR